MTNKPRTYTFSMEPINRDAYMILELCKNRLYDEVNYNVYYAGKGNGRSPARMLRQFGFSNKNKKRLLEEVTTYLSNIKVV